MHRLERLITVFLVLAALSCASTPRGQPPAGAGAGRPLPATGYERVVRPFPVLDASGREHALPFLGGLNAPRAQFVDIDEDGDFDLFLQEFTGSVAFFENVGTAEAHRFEWRTDRYQDLDVGEWYRFADVDGDGRVDLLAEEPYSYIRLYRNEGKPGSPRFVYADSLRDSAGQAIFMDRQNVPALVDVDCNGRLDLFVGRVEGTVARYEAERPGSHRFSFITERWEDIEIIGAFASPNGLGPGGSSRHGANALAFADFEGDGDSDLFWGDFFEPGLLVIENVGRTCSSFSFSTEPYLFPAEGVRTSGYNAPAPVDLDGDGLLDMAMGVLGGAYNPNLTLADNFYFWSQAEDGGFELRTRRFLDGVDLGAESMPALVDLDGDGLLDMVIGSKIDPDAQDSGLLLVFRNEGTARSPRYRLTDSLRVATAYHQAPAFGDLDGDGVPDLVLGTWDGDVLVFRQRPRGGRFEFARDDAASFRLPRGTNAAPALADLDGDGLLDLLVGQANGAIAHYRNVGSAREPRFALVTETLDGIDVGRRSVPALLDFDGDGLLDLAVGREDGGLQWFRNAGSAAGPRFVEHAGPVIPLPPMSAPSFADLDGDGVLDLVSGGVGGGIVFWRGTR